jgi:DNA-binding NarL/FixJ family response regulator
MNRSKIVYFIPTFCTKDSNEIESVKQVIGVIESNSDLKVNMCVGWNNLIELLQNDNKNNLLIVFRLDFLERKDMEIDEVLYMLSSLTKFLKNQKKVDLAVIVREVCSQELILKFKRNKILGVIPGLRFFEKSNSIEAYTKLSEGKSHWPEVVIRPELKRVETKNKEMKLTNRQYEIFNLISRRGLSNKKISELLKINEDTVKYHVGNILKKYSVQNRNQLILCNLSGAYKNATEVEESVK